ncbi:MAG TPA: TAT-variant-translocated molybdopterin oxidoreductase [Stellaceae bacterium]|nr:TAT-variant-translocated molybdopterin oxidoreductase [Stellaceae bacterium]
MSPRRRDYWRSLEELAETPDFRARLAHVQPRLAVALSGLDRRRFLQLMAASLALGGLAGCGPEPQQRELLPYVEQPPGIVPGRSRFYATALTLEGDATGVLIAHQMGRPIKVEGNPDHPASLGATSAVMQASILDLYDPHRSQSIARRGQLADWEDFIAAIVARREHLGTGAGLRLLTGRLTSPGLATQIQVLQQQFPDMRWHQWEPLHRDEAHAAALTAFGRPLDLLLDAEKAEVIFAVESDLISAAPGHLAYARALAARRRRLEAGGAMSRIYAIESTPTLLGAKADHRLALSPDEIARALRALAAALGAAPADWAHQDALPTAWLAAAAQDLQQHRGRSLVHAGREQPAEIQALVHAINAALGNFGTTVRLIEPVAAEAVDRRQSLTELAGDMAAGKVDTLLMLDTNPVYSAPDDLDFAGALGRVPFSVSLARYADETALASTWQLPAAHEYECWGDARAFDGTISLQQPQVRPLYGGRSAHALLAVLQGDTAPDDYASLRDRWQIEAQHRGFGAFDPFWHDALQRGVVEGSASMTIDLQPREDLAAQLPPPARPASGLRLLFRADSAVIDGRFADNAWLLELPRPFTRLTWDCAALVAPATAARLGVADGDVATIASEGGRLEAPVFVLPGQAADCITLPLGFGRRAGGLAVGVGFDAYRLRRAAAWSAPAQPLEKTGRRVALATVQGHDRMAGHDLVREVNLIALQRDPRALRHDEPAASLYPGFRYQSDAWAMAIDLNSCIGCQACVAACQAENNVPVVGKEEVLAGREMHWLRVDRYYSGSPDAPSIAFQPVPCMHCENAPCEVVCPVDATVHDHEGLNAMVYNRCVGTRFCSNNCPYKVRRFNFFAYARMDGRPAESWNPDVSVRDRGVMEKCSYCVQRIRRAQIDADREDRRVRDGEIVTACQQACPTQAIVFGDRNDPESAVARRKAGPLDYALLEELNTRPRTTYQAIVRNGNPVLEDKS